MKCFGQEHIYILDTRFFSTNVMQNEYEGLFLEIKKEGTTKEYFHTKIEDIAVDKKTKLELIKAIKTAQKWAKINKEQKKSFEKEIIRFEFTSKKDFKFFKKYFGHVTEVKISFLGRANGTFFVSFIKNPNERYDDGNTIFQMDSESQLNDFLLKLENKSTNPEIDNLFKKD